jgi:thiamine-phosphate pyrophosphorylase
MKLKGLYAITDERLTPYHRIEEMVAAAIEGGASVVQLRDKGLEDHLLEPIAARLLQICERYGALFIVNDRVELAARIGAHGVHIGKDDAGYSHARRLMGDRIVGVSCYDSMELATHYEGLGADYVAFGSVFPSPTKPGAVRAELSLIREASQRLSVPVCAIGGITQQNVHLVAEAGADMAAVISGLWAEGDLEAIRKRARAIGSAFVHGGADRK